MQAKKTQTRRRAETPTLFAEDRFVDAPALYNYGVQVVYNTFPWCTPTDKQHAAIEASAQRILDVRANYPDATFADLYDPLSMPKDLLDAHKKRPRGRRRFRS